MTRKSCAVGMRNAIPTNYLIIHEVAFTELSLQFFRDLVVIARATIACHTSVFDARAKMTQVTSRIIKNHFSTWKALNLFGICGDSFKFRSNMYSSLGPKKYGKKFDVHPVKALAFSHAIHGDTWARAWIKGMRNSILVQGCKNLSLIKDCSKTYRTTYDEIFTVDLLGWITFGAKILKKSVRQILSYFWFHILLVCKKNLSYRFLFYFAWI